MRRTYATNEDGEKILCLSETDKTPLGALKLMIEMVEYCDRGGCFKYVSCAEDGGTLYYGAVANAKQILKENSLGQ